MQERRLARTQELMYLITKTLRQTGEQVESNDNECLVRFVVVFRILLEKLILRQAYVYDGNAALINGLGVWRESRSCSYGHG